MGQQPDCRRGLLVDSGRSCDGPRVGRTRLGGAGCKNSSGLFIHEKAPSLFRPEGVARGDGCTSGGSLKNPDVLIPAVGGNDVFKEQDTFRG